MPPDEREPGRCFAQNLVAQRQALIADDAGAIGGHHGRHLVALLRAERALFCRRLRGYLLDRGDGRAGRATGLGDYRVRTAYTAVADVTVRPCDQQLDLPLAAAAKRAQKKLW